MASPQKENGFTPIAHEILEALARQDIARRAWRILMLMFRESYGRQRKQFALSLREISLRTGIAKPHCSVSLKELVVTNMVTASRVTGNGNHPKNSYIFQKDYHQWGVTKPVTVTNMVTEGLPNPVTPPTPPYKDIERKDKQQRVPAKASPEPVKPYETPNYKTDPIPAIVHVYKLIKGFAADDRTWDKHYFGRFMKSAKSLNDIFAGDTVQAMTCVESLGTRFNDQGLTWTLETVIKHAADWRLKGTNGNSRRNSDMQSVCLPRSKQRSEVETSTNGGFASSGEVLNAVRDRIGI